MIDGKKVISQWLAMASDQGHELLRELTTVVLIVTKSESGLKSWPTLSAIALLAAPTERVAAPIQHSRDPELRAPRAYQSLEAFRNDRNRLTENQLVEVAVRVAARSTTLERALSLYRLAARDSTNKKIASSGLLPNSKSVQLSCGVGLDVTHLTTPNLPVGGETNRWARFIRPLPGIPPGHFLGTE